MDDGWCLKRNTSGCSYNSSQSVPMQYYPPPFYPANNNQSVPLHNYPYCPGSSSQLLAAHCYSYPCNSDNNFSLVSDHGYPYAYSYDDSPQELAQSLPQAQHPCPPPQNTCITHPQTLSSREEEPLASNIKPLSNGNNPREMRKKAEKQRRDDLNESISKLASIVPPVVGAGRKMDKTSVLRLTAHYLRSHQYVFGDLVHRHRAFTSGFVRVLLKMLNGFLITTTYKGIIVVVSPNIQEYLGYSELQLLGHNIFNIVHKDDHANLRENLTPKFSLLGSNGELLLPDDEEGQQEVAKMLANDKRTFIVRFKKFNQQRSAPPIYVTCHIEGSLKKSEKANSSNRRPINRRGRTRGINPFASGNDVVFIGLVRPVSQTFVSQSAMEEFRMEYRTRHSVDGEIIQCDHRIALVTGYMMREVNGVNAMNFMHKDDVRWVIIALRQMYDRNQVFGESCYRLMTKNGKFIYLRTCGYLDVDQHSQAVTSFVCTNTLVDEQQGKQLIQEMKKKYALSIDEDITTDNDYVKDDDKQLAVEDPRQLERVILHLVTNLPPPQIKKSSDNIQSDSDLSRLAIIPPRRERIICAIERSYNVIKYLQESEKFVKTTKFKDKMTNEGKKFDEMPKSGSETPQELSMDLHNETLGPSMPCHQVMEQVLDIENEEIPASSTVEIMSTSKIDSITTPEVETVSELNTTNSVALNETPSITTSVEIIAGTTTGSTLGESVTDNRAKEENDVSSAEENKPNQEIFTIKLILPILELPKTKLDYVLQTTSVTQNEESNTINNGKLTYSVYCDQLSNDSIASTSGMKRPNAELSTEEISNNKTPKIETNSSAEISSRPSSEIPRRNSFENAHSNFSDPPNPTRNPSVNVPMNSPENDFRNESSNTNQTVNVADIPLIFNSVYDRMLMELLRDCKHMGLKDEVKFIDFFENITSESLELEEYEDDDASQMENDSDIELDDEDDLAAVAQARRCNDGSE